MILQYNNDIYIPDKIKRDIILSDFTTFKVGGPSDYFINIETEEEFTEAILWAIKKNIPYFIIGRGANVLVSDDGYRGLTIYTGRFNNLSEKNGTIFSQCGVLIDDLVDYTCTKSLKGLEFLAGMPGTVGGAVYMNSRAYKSEISQVIKDARVLHLDLKKKEVEKLILQKKDMQFSYKDSAFQKENIYLLEARFELENGEAEDIKKKVSKIRLLRKEKGEYMFPSAGCIFKNNYAIGRSSGSIIDECGLKGKSIGNAEIYDRHANFIVNKGRARSEDIYRLIKLVEKEVKEKTGIKLEREIILIGF